MTQLINNWEDLGKCESKNYKIELEDSGVCGWIVPKHETEETENNWFEHHCYLSTHTFYGHQYMESNKLLRRYGFKVKLVSWD